jgi:hypothetical protein
LGHGPAAHGHDPPSSGTNPRREGLLARGLPAERRENATLGVPLGGLRQALRRARAVASRISAATSGSGAGAVRVLGNAGPGTPSWSRSLARAEARTSWRPACPPQMGHRGFIRASIRPTVASDQRVPVWAKRASATRRRPQVGYWPRSPHTSRSSSRDHVERRGIGGRRARARLGCWGWAAERPSQR